MNVDLTLGDVFKAIGDLLVTVLPSGTTVAQGQVNRVPAPKGSNYVVMWPLNRERLSTNVDTWDITQANPSELSLLSPGQLTIQLDVHGPASADNVALIETLWRSAYGCDALALVGDMAPLYCGTPRQMAFINGEQQYEDRWSVDVVLQVNQNLVLTQDFADSLVAGVISVDAAYPPA